MSDLEQLVPLDGVSRFLSERFGRSASDVEVTRLGEGHSNLTFLLRRGDDEWVLRRPPRGEILPGTHEMHREYKVMKAIADNGMSVPVPRPVELCDDASYIGAPFYLMSYVEGVVVRGAIPFEDKRGVGFELVDKLADIHSLDWRAIGLADMARRPEQFLSRNLRRMQELYDAVRHREVPEVDEAGEWLREHAPEQTGVTLTHGDYKLDNVMLSDERDERSELSSSEARGVRGAQRPRSTDPPPRIVAVVDWEVSAIGDPMVDLGWLLYFAPDDDGSGYPSRAETAERYAERTGRSLGDLRFYTAMAGWKIAIIMEGSNARYKQGMADDAMFSALDAMVPALAGRALQIIRGEIAVGA